MSADAPRRLNLGCGRRAQPGWINLDSMALPGVDVVADLDRCADAPLPFEPDSIDEFLLSHVIEHLRHTLPLMQELHRIARPGAALTIRVPYGGSDDAWEDPTHLRPYFLNSFAYFSQPAYWRADYGYRGDWQPEQIALLIPAAQTEGLSAQDVMKKVLGERNVVREMIARLVAVKPIRPPQRELQQAPKIAITKV
ncbi:MAG: methyltransferase domain-containing protein [Rhodospirillales bacterium]